VNVVLVDGNLLLDVISDDPRWSGWSADALVRCADAAVLAINP